MSFSASWLTFNHARRDALILMRLPDVSSPQTENSLSTNACEGMKSCATSCRVETLQFAYGSRNPTHRHRNPVAQSLTEYQRYTDSDDILLVEQL